MIRLSAAVLFAATALSAAPAVAQDTASDDVRMSIVYGADAAPECPAGEICVVARLPEEDRFRIPPTLRFSDDPDNNAWTNRVEKLEMIGDFGTMSCSTAGSFLSASFIWWARMSPPSRPVRPTALPPAALIRPTMSC